jgi:hypothetical protein
VLDVDEQAIDVSFLIDTFVAFNADSASPFFGRIDTDTIGTVGHSLGGATVLVNGYHVTVGDPRVSAVLALAPLACVFIDPFFDGGTAPLMIMGGTDDLITGYSSNQATPYTIVNPSRYLVTFDGGLHMGFNDFIPLCTPANANCDDQVACSFFVGPGDPRPVTFDADLPPDYLGGAPAGVDTTAAACEPVCPLPEPGHMVHARQYELVLAGAHGFFDAILGGGVSGRRLITDKLDSENADLSVSFEE